MLRHDHVTDDYKPMALPNLLQHFEEEIARARCVQQGTPLIATCGNKVEVSGAVVALQAFRHENDVTQPRRF